MPTVFLAMEILDNLPHDKIRRCRTSRRFEQAEIRNTAGMTPELLNNDSDSQLEEVFVPLEDTLLSRILESVPAYGGTALGRPTWVPTVACGVLEHISRVRPNARMALADFDYLPPPDLTPSHRRSSFANEEPIITSMDGIDHECYLEAPPFCDILFPTDFSKLASMARKCWGAGVTVNTMKQSHFLEQYGKEEVNATKSWLTGYSPLIHDFGNCSVLTMTQDREV